MALSGQCHCGAVRYSVEGEPEHHALCHCGDCRRWSGAPMSGWIAFRADRVSVTGETSEYRSSEHGRRDFCGTCGTGLFYHNAEVLPGLIDIQSGTLDDPGAVVPGAEIMTNERLAWLDDLADLPKFSTYPGMDA